jgi:hypothetical protein
LKDQRPRKDQPWHLTPETLYPLPNRRRHHRDGVCAATASTDVVRRGRRPNSPPQFGQTAAMASVQGEQNVHSKLQT